MVKELDSLEMSVRLQPHLPIHRLLDDEAHSAKLRLESQSMLHVEGTLPEFFFQMNKLSAQGCVMCTA